MRARHLPPLMMLALSIAACEPPPAPLSEDLHAPPVTIRQTGSLESWSLVETSGLQASHSNQGHFYAHNDEGGPLVYIIDGAGKHLGDVAIVPAKNKDWEDITSVPVNGDRWIVVGDIGDNKTKRKSVKLYFIAEPRPGQRGLYGGDMMLQHSLELTYPDGPRDCEAMAYDPVGERILLLSKRDKPARLYAVGLANALESDWAELKFLGPIYPLRPPTRADQARFGGRTDWISQPTGLDIRPDGNEAIVLTYRSLYRFRRQAGEDWSAALQKKPDEVVGPPAVQNEAVSYTADGQAVYVTTEKLPSPVYRIEFEDAAD